MEKPQNPAAASAQAIQKTVEKIEAKTEELYRARTVFPFEFFPVEIVVDTAKVTFDRMTFIGSHQLYSVAIPDILNIEAETNIFFGTLRFIERVPMQADNEVRFLPVKDALKIREIVQGLIVASTEKIDLTPVAKAEVLPQVKKLGKTTIQQM